MLKAIIRFSIRFRGVIIALAFYWPVMASILFPR